MSKAPKKTKESSLVMVLPNVAASTAGGYRDFSNVEPPQDFDLDPATNVTLESIQSLSQPFPGKLHSLLTFAETDEESLHQIVSWQPHGRAFMVHDTKEFVAKVLPNWFSQTKLASFQRQLNLYGFSRFTSGPDKGGWYHEFFLRGRSDLAEQIRRTKVKGGGRRKSTDILSEPNFYREFPLTARRLVSHVANPIASKDIHRELAASNKRVVVSSSSTDNNHHPANPLQPLPVISASTPIVGTVTTRKMTPARATTSSSTSTTSSSSISTVTQSSSTVATISNAQHTPTKNAGGGMDKFSAAILLGNDVFAGFGAPNPATSFSLPKQPTGRPNNQDIILDALRASAPFYSNFASSSS